MTHLSSGPGHFLEVEKMLPLLTAPSAEHPSFHVVAPSLPGFGFSEYTTKTGFGLAEYAEVNALQDVPGDSKTDGSGRVGLRQAHARPGI
jgi:pimeloyl-ACP methyl ester carboxylesterase